MKHIKLFENFEYFFEKDEILDTNIRLISTSKEPYYYKGEYEWDIHTFIVDEIPSIPHGINTRHTNYVEMVNFFGQYIKLKDDEFSNKLENLNMNDEVIIKTEDGKHEYKIGVSDLVDFSR